MITSQAATVLAAFRHLKSMAMVTAPDRAPDVMANIAAAVPSIPRGEGEDIEKGFDPLTRKRAEKRELQDVAIVQESRGVGNRLVRIGRRTLDEQRLGRDAYRQGGPTCRGVDGVGEPIERLADGRMFRWVQGPVARCRQERASEPQHGARQVGREL